MHGRRGRWDSGQWVATGLLVILWLSVMSVLVPTGQVTAAPMTYTVTNTNASGSGSLAAAVAASNANDPGVGQNTILFAAGVTGTITVGATLQLTRSVTIDGTGRSITVSGGCTGCGANGSGGTGGVQVLSVNAGVTATVTALTITEGGADINSGGGVVNSGTLTLINTTVRDSAATAGGGILNGGTLTLNGSTVSGNRATMFGGGGILNSSDPTNGVATLTVVNSTVSGNVANGGGTGGGIQNSNFGSGMVTGVVTLTNVTVSGNTANAAGGVANSDAAAGGTVTARNTIIANNTAIIGGAGDDTDGGVTAVGSNLIGVPVPLAPLANNGGLTQTQLPLAGTNTAIDAGDNAVCAAAPVNNRDQRGIVRPQGARCDIGAVEVQAAAPPTIDSVGPTSGDQRGGSLVRITGTGFVPGSTSVTFGGATATILSVTATEILLRTPAGTGVVDVIVTANGVGTTKMAGYMYGVVAPAPMPARAAATVAGSVASSSAA